MLLCLIPRVISPSFNTAKFGGVRCTRQFLWSSSSVYISKWLCLYYFSQIVRVNFFCLHLSGAFSQSFFLFSYWHLEKYFLKYENCYFGFIWCVFIFLSSYAFPDSMLLSDIVSTLDYHIWRQLISICPSVVNFNLNQRVKWLLIFLLIVTFFFPYS